MKTNARFTAKSLDAALPALNETLAKLADPYRFVAGGCNGYTAVDLATPEQANRFCSARNLETGTPRECLAACHAYVSEAARRFAHNPAAAIAAESREMLAGNPSPEAIETARAMLAAV